MIVPKKWRQKLAGSDVVRESKVSEAPANRNTERHESQDWWRPLYYPVIERVVGLSPKGREPDDHLCNPFFCFIKHSEGCF